MTRQFHERYITREEHNSIVAYYRKLVVQLQQKRQHGKGEPNDPSTHEGVDKTATAQGSDSTFGDGEGSLGSGNVVRLDFSRRGLPRSR